jgi:galactose mutarotase-like enzyme
MPSFQGLGGLETYVLEDGEARVEVIPSRGALVTRMNVAGDELLYLDESTVVDLSKNVRGGIPVLFPTAGKLPGDTYPVGRQSYTMPQHGFARRLPWVVRQEEKDLLVVGLTSSEETLKQFPWRFDAQLTFSLDGPQLTLDFDVENKDTRPPAGAPGFPPLLLGAAELQDGGQRGDGRDTGLGQPHGQGGAAGEGLRLRGAVDGLGGSAGHGRGVDPRGPG